MLAVKRVVKCIALSFGAVVLLAVVLGFIGFRWGLTPLPKPPPGVRIKPLLPPIARENLTPENGAFQYMRAVDFIQRRYLPDEFEDQIQALLDGSIPAKINGLERTISDFGPALDLVRQGTHTPSCQMPQLDLTVDTNAFRSLRLAARLLVADGKLAENQGDFTRAIDDYLTVVKFGVDCAKGGTIMYALIGDAIESLGSQAIRAYVLQNTNPSGDTQSIMEKLSRIYSERMPFAETLRYELEGLKGTMDQALLDQTNSWQQLLISRDEVFVYFEAAFGELIQDAERPLWESNTKAIMRKWERDKPIWRTALNRPIPRILVAMMLPNIGSARNRTIRAELELEATTVVCALKSYEIIHGAPPNQLSDLTSDLLPSLPMDPFDGKPLRYRHEGKEWVVWSVGSDRKDDNAAWHEFKYRKHDDYRIGGDIYFKSTEPQDDLAFYLSQQKVKASGTTLSKRTPTAAP